MNKELMVIAAMWQSSNVEPCSWSMIRLGVSVHVCARYISISLNVARVPVIVPFGGYFPSPLPLSLVRSLEPAHLNPKQ